MNDPTKVIEVEKSSLLSLKAEMLRKQEEVKNKKLIPFVPTKLKKEQKSSKSQLTAGPVVQKYHEVEDSKLLSRSRRILEKKAKYYDDMVANKGLTNTDSNSLVMFSKKTQLSSRKYSDEDSDDEYVDYTDCFGRTRKILKKDLDKKKKEDADLSSVAESRTDQLNPNREESSPEPDRSKEENLSSDNDDTESFIGPDVGLQFLKQREEWQEQEELNAQRESTHYADVLFNEARDHGTLFYEFSRDHETRTKQQEALKKIRENTLDAQKQRENLKTKRDDIIKNRVKSAKARVRAKLGLPPEEESPEENVPLYDATDKKQIEDEKSRVEKEEIEKQKELDRKNYVRPWDREKLSGSSKLKAAADSSDSETEIDWKPRREYQPLTQEEWNTRQRLQRKQEFAPKYNNFVKAADDDTELEPVAAESPFFATTKKKFKRRNESPESNTSFVTEQRACIPPPATMEYYGPSSSKHKRSQVPVANLEDSIAQGLKYLREQVDKGNKHKFTATNDYNN